MTVNKKYAKVMYYYLLETLLEQEQYELYIYVLTVLHTGLRTSDMLELTWEQYKGNKFEEVKMHKASELFGRDVREDVLIYDPDMYNARLKAVKDKVSFHGKLCNFKSKQAITTLLRRHTGTMLFAHELRVFYHQLLEL